MHENTVWVFLYTFISIDTFLRWFYVVAAIDDQIESQVWSFISWPPNDISAHFWDALLQQGRAGSAQALKPDLSLN